jgi:DNA recombination-mediator protein A
MSVSTASRSNIIQQKEVGIRSIGIIGSRSLSYEIADHVGNIVEDILERGFHVASGGAIGADQFVIERLMHLGRSESCTVYSAWKRYDGFPLKVRAMMRQFKDYGGHILWGMSGDKANDLGVKLALLSRNQKLVEACHGIVAFITGGSRGTIYTIKEATKRRMPLVVFPISSMALKSSCDPGLLPALPHVKWVPLRCGGCWDGSFKAVYLR